MLVQYPLALLYMKLKPNFILFLKKNNKAYKIKFEYNVIKIHDFNSKYFISCTFKDVQVHLVYDLIAQSV